MAVRIVPPNDTQWTTAQVTVTVQFARPATVGEPPRAARGEENRQFDFSAFIADRTKDFTGREWVFAEIDRWLADPNGPSFFIITGEPGVGKSAIAARLTQIKELAAYHFCIARQAATIDPVLFARSLSQQLCRIDGFALGILKDSAVDLKITQQVQANYGQVIGARIENLVVNAPSGSAAFTHAVLQPLKALYADGHSSQVVLLVDALDEAVQHQGSETIVDLLANIGELPRQVRLVLTSRPEGAALRHFQERQIPHFRLDAGRPENLEDIRRYVRGKLVASDIIQGQLADQRMPDAEFVEQVTAASQGNFLYVSLLLQEIARGTQSLDLKALPMSLEALLRGTPLEIETQPFEPFTILIPGGSFLMGSDDPTAPASEQPQHMISLPDFRIGKYPVTNREYAEFIKDQKDHPAPEGWFDREPPAILDHPVTGVSWFDAVAYCAWLSEQTGRPYALPSEAEWEKASSGPGHGEPTPKPVVESTVTQEEASSGPGDGKRRYPWGDEWVDGRCTVGGSGTTAVTEHPDGASAYGVEDLLGNVQEWTRSLWGSQPDRPDFAYPYDPSDGRELVDPAKMPAQARLVHRGGSFKSSPADLRCSARGNALPDSKIAWRGFRVALAV